MNTPRIERDELVILNELVPLAAQRVIELGCGSARVLRDLLARYPACTGAGLEVDRIQHEKNLAEPAERLEFVAAGAADIPFGDGEFGLALMLKSLHHVPVEQMDAALAEIRRVLVYGGHLYVSEPVYDGPLNEVVRLFNDEGEVRAAAQEALDRAVAAGGWQRETDYHFSMPVHYADHHDFEQRMLDVSFAERHVDDDLRQRIRAALVPHTGPDGIRFVRPMHVTLLSKMG